MSGFEPDWLALREPEDHRARAGSVARACVDHFGGRRSLRIVDIGCGAGSNLRALAPMFALEQSWRLVDHDARLLAVARARLSAWADRSEEIDNGLRLSKGGRVIHVVFEQRDLARDLDPLFAATADLVTAAALFDLVSADWIDRFCAALSARGLPLLALLTYNGVEEWRPPHPADAAVLAAFHAHQARDKGFGPSVGPRAPQALLAALEKRGYRVSAGASDWRLAAGTALARALADGVAQAARETGLVPGQEIEQWRLARQNAQARIGHEDLFAAPA